MWERSPQTGAHAPPHLSHNTECSYLCGIFGNQNINSCANFSFSATPCQLSTVDPALLRVCSQTVGTGRALLVWPRGCSVSILSCSLSVSGLPAVRDPHKSNSCGVGFCRLLIKLVVAHLGLSPSHEWLASSSPPLRAGSHPYLLHARLPCPSLSLKVCSNSCLLNLWCYLTLCRPLLLPSIFPSIRVFSRESTFRIRWPKYWSFSNSSSNEYSVLISFKIDWFDILAVQGTLKSSSAQFKSISSSRLSLYGWLLEAVPNCQPGSGKRSSHLQVKWPRRGLTVVLYSQPSNSPSQRIEVPGINGLAPQFVSTYEPSPAPPLPGYGERLNATSCPAPQPWSGSLGHSYRCVTGSWVQFPVPSRLRSSGAWTACVRRGPRRMGATRRIPTPQKPQPGSGTLRKISSWRLQLVGWRCILPATSWQRGTWTGTCSCKCRAEMGAWRVWWA